MCLCTKTVLFYSQKWWLNFSTCLNSFVDWSFRTTMGQYEYYTKSVRGVELPASFIDIDILNDNLYDLVKRAKTKTIRVASKSIRSVEVLNHIFKFSSCFKGIMAFTLKEALFLAEKGFDDILLGYPDMQPELLLKVLGKIKEGKNITLMVDLSAHIQQLDKLAHKLGVKVPVCIDLDMSIALPGLWFGVYRSSLRTQKDIQAFAQELKQLNHIEVVGLMGYEAQIAGVVDNEKGNVLKNHAVRLLKKISIPKIAARRKAAVQTLEKVLGKKLSLVNAGGTGSLESSIKEDWVTEVTVGSGVYASHLFDNYMAFRHRPAAFYGIQVVRNPSENIYVAHGGGYIASGSVEALKAPKPYLPENMQLFANEGAGEVQTPFRYKESLPIGSPVFFRHAKAGELFERFNEIHIISKGALVQKMKTYRGEGQSFL